ncbi:hypothetical protein GCM10009850_024410 [Nonomuraea monospora]|uniref:Pseudouridine synthase n=1 Tax=Nonomuraea monospora TaxID=568818 RepID=A0ABP5P5M8_9ACTN
MINRRSTPSGDGRGRGRTGGSGRGGRPAFRSDDTRGDSRGGGRGGFRRDDDFRSTGGPRRDGGFRDDSRRDGGSRDDSRRDGGFRDDSRRDGFRDRPSRDSLRADRGGVRARYGGRRDGENEGRPARDFGGRGDRTGRDERPGGAGRFGRDERSGRDDRSGGAGRYERSGGAGSSGRDGRSGRDDRFGGRSDRFGDRDSRYGRDERPARGGDRGAYRTEAGDRRPDAGRDFRRDTGRDDRRDFRREAGRDDRRDYGRDAVRDDRRDAGRDDRRSYGRDAGRDDRRSYGRDAGRDAVRDGRPDDRHDGRPDARRDDRRDDRRGDRGDVRTGGFRAGRSGRREDVAPRPTSSSRSRYGRRDDADDRQPGRGADRRAPRRDDVQTIGGGARRPSYNSPQHNRVKAARQPLRDRDLFPEGYTDERDTTEVPGGVRLQKVLAQAGVASRRACEEMIGDGRVTVNGQVVRRFGAKVDPATQIIHVDGKRIPTAPDLVYYAINKPIGVVSTMDDPQGRPCLADYVEELAPRLFHVGRLDTETEGLLLLTNDGELANRLTHPSYGVQKKYWAKVPGPIPRDLGRRLKQGIELEDGLARADAFSIVQEHGQQALVEVVLHEGRKHVVRRMLEEAGHRVIDLARIEFGPVKLGRTKPGTVRALTLKEVGELYAAVKL